MQTGDSFRMRIGSVRKALKSRVEFEFLDAPFLVRAAAKGRSGSCASDAARRRGLLPRAHAGQALYAPPLRHPVVPAFAAATRRPTTR
jgi:hypothetical protein